MLEGKHVVVISGSSGIGLEVARLASLRGARVTITGRDEVRLKSAAGSVGGDVKTAAFDATDRVALQDFCTQSDMIDHLVSCFGDTEWGSFLDLDETRAREVVEHKFWAQLAIVRAARGKIALDGSLTLTAGTVWDRAPVPIPAAFSVVGNTALEVMVRGLAGELAPIRVNLIEPTVTDTPLFADMDASAKQELFDSYAPLLPIGRIPKPEEVARSYIHLMESGLINGDRIRPDGGPTLSSPRTSE
jgi:NAD(P)-dependent dehydrogenase (short-subunit alcohol dehydrogenase family)